MPAPQDKILSIWGLKNGFSGPLGYRLNGLVMMGFFIAMSEVGEGMEQDMKKKNEIKTETRSKTKTKIKK